MGNKVGTAVRIPTVRYDKELQGDRGKRIKAAQIKRATEGEVMTTRALILSLVDLGLDTIEQEINP